MKHRVYVISASRYADLPFTDKEKKEFVFCVKNGQKALYEEHGCANVFETGKLVESRNWALDHAFKDKLICVQLSDDVKKITINKNFGEKKVVPLSEAIEDIVNKFDKTSGFYLMGIPPTNNDFFAKKMTATNVFCIGDALFVKPSAPRFDTNLSLKEDYDFTLSHIKQYKTVVRYHKYLWEFAHYSNAGGAVDYRSDTTEQANIDYLLRKWGDAIKLNPKRKNEILMT